MSESPSEPGQSTEWSVVLAAGSTDSQVARPALERLCRTYWGPLRGFARRQGLGPEDSEDLVQGFFASLLQHDYLRRVDPARGRFRSFLYASLRHYLYNQLDARRALKRGGGSSVLSLDELGSRETGPWEPSVAPAPDAQFDRDWALTLLGESLGEVGSRYGQEGKTALFNHLQPYLSVDTAGGGYAEPALAAGMTEGAFKVAVHRARERFRETLRRRIGETVSAAADIEDEYNHLLAALRAPA